MVRINGGKQAMPLDRSQCGTPRVERGGTYLRWVMRDGDDAVTCRILADTLRELFDGPDADAVDLFLGNQSEVEQAAQERYAAMGAPDGVVELEHIDFI
ncbi:hypothetical protein AKJ13_24445 [Methylobacterium sp. ARG-1]|nr:hypothetical protein AKJ13_24445 [Methylobacterium sp. ARG-1]